MNQHPILPILLTILMAIVFVMMCVIGEVKQETGFDHPSLPKETVLQAPDGFTRHQATVWIGGCYGVLVSLFTVTCMALGLNRRRSVGVGKLVLLGLGGLYAASFALVVVLYWHLINESAQQYVLGFPLPTACMLYLHGIVVPTLLLVFYMASFHHWILTQEDMNRFETLVAARRARRTE